MSETPLLALSGAGLAPWIWDDTLRGLDAVVVPAGFGGGHSLSAYAETALGLIAAPQFTILAHSGGGMVATEILRIAPDRVSALLGITAVVPAPGRSFIGSMPLPARVVLSAVMRLAGTRPPASALRAALAAGVEEKLATRLIEDFHPESQRYFRDRVSAVAFPARRGYVHTSADRELAPDLQRRFAATLDPTREFTIACGHLPMLERSAELRTAITDFIG